MITVYITYSLRIYNITECRKKGWRYMQNKKEISDDRNV